MHWPILREDTCLKFIVSIFIDTSCKKRKKNDQLCRKGKGDKNVYFSYTFHKCYDCRTT